MKGQVIPHSKKRTHTNAELGNLKELTEHQSHGTHAEVNTGRPEKRLGLYSEGPEGQVKIFNFLSQEHSKAADITAGLLQHLNN